MKRNQWLAVTAVLLIAVLAAVLQLPATSANDSISIAVAPQDGFQILSENPVAAKPGENAVFRIQLMDGYVFSSVSAGRYENGYLTVPASNSGRTVYMTVLKECSISLLTDGRGEAQLVSNDPVMQGDTVSIRLSPEENYIPGSVSVNGTTYPAPSGNVFTFTAADDSLVEVSFQGMPVDFMMVSGNLGSAVVHGAPDSFHYGDALNIYCEFDSSYIAFDGWSTGGYLSDGGELVSTDAACTYTLTGDTILYANLRDRSTFRLTYDSNGGQSQEPLAEDHAPGEYVNVPLVDGTLTREGWTLLGFSTEPDGAGEPITPGGMFLMPREDITLYAQWVKNTPEDYFDYTVRSDAIIIDGLSSKGLEAAPAQLVIPAAIAGKQVTQISSGAFQSCGFLESVVLPIGLRTLYDSCFADCAELATVYFPETISYISPDAFSGCTAFSNMRVIASLPRVFDYAYDSAFADKYMRLTHAEGKRIILVGGSNLSFGINSAMIQEHFPDYTVVNMGVSIHYGILTQFDIIRANAREGDIIIFCPEYGHIVYTATAPVTITNWQYLESNYDILQDIDLRNNYYLLNQYVNYLSTKISYIPNKKYDENYVYSRAGMNSYGDLITHRDPLMRYSFEVPDISLLTTDGMNRYNELFRALTEQGALCCFTFPANPAGDVAADTMDAQLEPFFSKLSQLLDSRYVTIISRMSDCFIPGFVFYDSPYHMTLEGADIRTERLISDLTVYLEDRK